MFARTSTRLLFNKISINNSLIRKYKVSRNFGWCPYKQKEYPPDMEHSTPAIDIASAPAIETIVQETIVQENMENALEIETTYETTSEPIIESVNSQINFEENLELLLREKREFTNYNLNCDDIGNLTSSIEPCFAEDTQSVWNSLFAFSPMTCYDFLDEASRELTLLLAENGSLGMGGAIFLMSIMIKTCLTPFNMIAQIQGKF